MERGPYREHVKGQGSGVPEEEGAAGQAPGSLWGVQGPLERIRPFTLEVASTPRPLKLGLQ